MVIIVLVFGAAKLPGLAKSLGQSIKVFRKEVKNGEIESEANAHADKGDTPAEK